MNILALDLGTKTGWATSFDSSQGISIGTWNLASAKEISAWGKTRMRRRSDPRIFRLFENLEAFHNRVDLVVFEDVQFCSSTFQCQLWASLRAAIWISVCSPAVIIDCIPTGTLKRFATGSGAATKEMMLEAAINVTTNPELRKYDDNAIDAFWVLRWAKETFGRIKP